MKTIFYPIKCCKGGLTFLVLFCMFAMPQILLAQKGSIVFTLVKQPCNNDGILVATDTVPGATFPITWYWTLAGGQQIVQTSNTTSDTLLNYSGAYVYVEALTGANYVTGSYAGSPPFSFTDSTKTAVCPALSTAQVYITGGTPPYTVQWLTGNNTVASTSNPAYLPGGYYKVVITDSAGCVFGTPGVDSVISGGSPGTNGVGIYVPNTSNVKDSIATTKANCTNGTATVTKAYGGVAPYSYQWSNGANTPSITGLIEGTYWVTVTDSVGCTAENGVEIQQAVTISVHTTVTNDSCLQLSGSAIAFGSGGHPPYTYLWSAGSHADTISGLTGGLYYVTVTDSNNCIGNGYANISVTTPITVTYSTTPSSCTSPTGTATLAIAGGKGTYTVKWYTYPAQSGIAASGLAPGTYSFLVTDSVGCTRTGTVYIPPISPVTGSVLPGDAVCTQANGTAQAITITGTQPFTYLWSNGGTTQTISGLTPGYYSCTITDSLGCSAVKTGVVQSSSPIQLGLNVTQASCIFRSDGSVAATISGGTLPYTISWSNGESAATDSDLAAGRYYVYVEDSVGCVSSSWTDVSYNPYNDSCYCTLTGRVYLDSTNTCTYTAGDALIPNIMIHCDHFGYAFTNSSGVYSILVPTGSYTLSEKVETYYPLAACQNNAIAITVTAASGCVVDTDFVNIINPIHDIQINTCKVNDPVPGNTYWQKVVVKNNGSVTEPGIQLSYRDDGQLVFNTVAPNIFTQQAPNYYTITNGFPSLAPGASQAFDISYDVPADIPLGTSVLFNDTTAYATPISNWLNDYTPWNNVNAYTNVVIGSYDPNSKEVSPTGTGAPGYISQSDSVLTYTVHFQNTGTYLAENVVVVDSLNPNLDMTTLTPIYSNYSFTASMSETGVATFTFSNIDLPDISTSPIGSIGVLIYSAQQKHGLVNGTVIQSPATVYFDYNPPIQTNSTINTLGSVCNGFAIDSVKTINATCTSDSGAIIVFNTGGANPLSFSVDSGNNFQLNDTIKNLPASSYQVAIKDSNSCLVYYGTPVTITQPTLDTPLIVDHNNGTISDTLEVPQTYTTYQWYLNDSSLGAAGTSATYLATQSGLYKVFVTDASGCSAYSVNDVVKIYTGISQLSGIQNLTIYPNPTDGNINILVNTDEPQNSVILKIYDVIGNVLQLSNISLATGKNTISADVSSFATGIYFVEVSNGQSLQVQKFNVVK